MQLKKLFEKYNKLQKTYGDPNLDAIYGAGQINNPNLCLIFMNPTARNISSNKEWKGIKAPWIATKNIWKMFYQIGILDKELFEQIYLKNPKDWDYNFSNTVYQDIKNKSIYITNLSKATQIDARPLKDFIFKQYLDLLYQEISIIKPKLIITFGNQVSSIFLNKNIQVSKYRKTHELIEIYGSEYTVYPVYYPVGQGMRNINKVKEDIQSIING